MSIELPTRVVYTLTLTVPGMPATTLLTANQRLHWRERARRTDYWRTRAFHEARAAILRGDLKQLQRAHVVAYMRWPDARRRDVSNWMPTIKALVDGTVDAGMLIDDDDRRLLGPDMRRDAEKGPVAVRLEITDLGEAL